MFCLEGERIHILKFDYDVDVWMYWGNDVDNFTYIETSLEIDKVVLNNDDYVSYNRSHSQGQVCNNLAN